MTITIDSERSAFRVGQHAIYASDAGFIGYAADQGGYWTFKATDDASYRRFGWPERKTLKALKAELTRIANAPKGWAVAETETPQ